LDEEEKRLRELRLREKLIRKLGVASQVSRSAVEIMDCKKYRLTLHHTTCDQQQKLFIFGRNFPAVFNADTNIP